MKATWLLVHNARARRGRRLLPRVRARMAPPALPRGARLATVDVGELMRYGGSTEDLADVERVVALGGDGTANAVATWIIARGIDPLVAVVPGGTGNNLARDLGIPLDADRAVDLALAASGSESRRVDAVAYDAGSSSGVFVQLGALGFPADVVAWHQTLRRIPCVRSAVGSLGSFGYKLIALMSLGWTTLAKRRGSEAYHARVRLPGEEIEERVLAGFLGNGSSTGGGFVPCPGALLDDGLLDLCFVRAGPRRSYPGLFRSFARGRQRDRAEAIWYRRTRGPVEIGLSRPSRFLADGDLPSRTEQVRLEVLPSRLRFIVPRSRGGYSACR